VTVRAEHTYRLAIPARRRAARTLPGQRAGEYRVLVTGGARATLVVGGEPRARRARRAMPERGEDHDRARPAPGALRRAREAGQVGRRFMAGLLALDAGELGEARVRLAASATPELARSLLGGRPRRPAATARPAHGRVAGLEPLALRGRNRIELTAVVRRGGARSGLVLALERRDGRWRVSEIR
jgi:hypothetical protein